MAHNTVTTLVDDLDGSEAVATVRLTVNGTEFELDLSERNQQRLFAALEPFISVAREIKRSRRNGTRPGERAASRSVPARRGAKSPGGEDTSSSNGKTPSRAASKDKASSKNRASSQNRASSKNRAGSKDRADLSAVRTWARDNGFEVSERGRLRGEILSAYRAANG